MGNILESYLNIIQEGYLSDDQTISIDLNKFESGESNKLIIVGLSGAGKSTLGNYLANKYNCSYFNGDKCCKDNITEEERIEFVNGTSKEKIFKIFYDKCFEPSLKSNKKEVIEGVVYQSYFTFPSTRQFINQFPCIIIGKSAMKSSWDRWQRYLNRPKERTTYEKFIHLLRSFNLNFNHLQKQVDFFKEERIKSGGEVKKFEIPNLK